MQREDFERAGEAARRIAPCGLLSFSDDGTVVHADDRLHQWLETPSGELLGCRLEKLMSRPSWVFHNTHFFPLLRMHGKADEIHLTLRTALGAELPVMVSAVREPREDGPAHNHCSVMTMRRRKEFEAALVEARKGAEAATQAKDQFLATVSHELRTPLNAILGWVRLMQDDRLEPAMRQRALDTIERNAKAQSLLIEDLLDISRIVSGKMRLSPRPIELAPVVEAAIDTARPSAQAKDITLLTALDRSAGVVYADPDRMQQVVWNLVANAIKFTPKGGRVQATLARAGSRLRLEVADNGAGLSPSQLPHLFDRFWQADAMQRQERSGLGLGLSICRSLVELHGGTIGVASRGPGEGATFTVELPLAVAVASADTQARGAGREELQASLPAASLQGLRLLVADDDADARALLKMLLEGAGAQVRTVASCDEALQALQDEGVPDVLLSDVGMPGRDGFELIRLLRTGRAPRAVSVPAIAITGLARPQDRVNLLRAGFQAHLSKPVEPSEVIALVGALAGPRRAP
ncbi:ATP-binding protein [Caldimonas tepidiphila]|uniref:hybrid sensor histidine kinase/response regulator n=1 Tax=Caldimonas tepidiphila TaxID=2315841 RepID=UPI00196B068C|nr:PAS domain-containing hybrid sensor histidine kinase/response regulator [Caldimonas tepidiphila]